MSETTLILGLGNLLMTDEGVGAAVVQRLQSECGQDPRLNFMDGGTLSFTLAGPIGEHRRLIVVDAASLRESAGTMRVFEGDDMDQQLRSNATSVHEVSLADLMDMARLTDTLPAKRALVGIQPEVIDWGETLTPSVEAAVPVAVSAIRALLERWDAEVDALV